MVLEHVEKQFKEREKKVLEMIKTSPISYIEVGLFGSYARNDYRATSDIDFCVISMEKPDRYLTGDLRCDAEKWNADIVFVTKETFEQSDSLFLQNIRKDYRRLL